MKEQLKILEKYILKQINSSTPINLGSGWFSENDIYVEVDNPMGIEFFIDQPVSRELVYKESQDLINLANFIKVNVELTYDERDKVYLNLKEWHRDKKVAIARLYYSSIHSVTFIMDEDNKALSEVQINNFRFSLREKEPCTKK